MSISEKSVPIILLRWTLGLVVLWESFRFAASTAAAHHLQGMGLPFWLAPALGGVEILDERVERRGRRRAQWPMPTPWDRWSCLPSVCRAGATMTSAFWNSFTVS